MNTSLFIVARGVAVTGALGVACTSTVTGTGTFEADGGPADATASAGGGEAPRDAHADAPASGGAGGPDASGGGGAVTGGTGGTAPDDSGAGGASGDGGTGGGPVDGCPAATHRCVPPAPPQWQGPVYWFNDAFSAAPPECADGTDGYAGSFNADPATCPSCSCGKPSASSCVVEDRGGAIGYSDGACLMNARAISTLQLGGGCFVLPDHSPPGSYSDSVKPPALQFVPGSCESVETGSEEIAPWTFAERVAVCPALAMDGCVGTDRCVPLPEAPYSSRICVHKAAASGDACPPNFTRQFVLHSTVDDARACEPCGCDAPADGTCGGTVTAYTDTGCTDDGLDSAYDAACVPLSLNRRSFAVTVTVPNEGSCPVTGGASIGEAAPAGTRTVCCE